MFLALHNKNLNYIVSCKYAHRFLIALVVKKYDYRGEIEIEAY